VGLSLPPPLTPLAETLPLGIEAEGVMEEVGRGEVVGVPVPPPPFPPPDDTVALGVGGALRVDLKLTVGAALALEEGVPVPPPITPSPAPPPGAVWVTVGVGEGGAMEGEGSEVVDPPPPPLSPGGDLLWLGEGVMDLEGKGDREALGEGEGCSDCVACPLLDTLGDRETSGVMEGRRGVGVREASPLGLVLGD
jgi:hypothetical protein